MSSHQTGQTADPGARTSTRPRPRTGREILLVEDEPLVREIFAKALSRNGYRVTVARDGLQALHQLWKRAPDLIVLDLCLPVVPGFEVLRRLREAEGPTAPPVIVVTAQPEAEVSERARGYGAAACLHKPFRTRELLDTVRELLERDG